MMFNINKKNKETKSDETKKKRKINYQKIFNFASAGFIIACCIFYGTRFITLYLENYKEEQIEENTLAKKIKESDLKKIDNEHYFYGDTDNNYVTYSNILWRIIKVNDNNEIKLISDDFVTILAYGEDLEYNDSYINTWLNSNDSDNTGILENVFNKNYLVKDAICTDKVNDNKNITCKNKNSDNLIGNLSVYDYINAGGTNSYLNNETYFYLSTTNDNNEIWYVTNEGKVSTTDGKDIYGVRPTITLKSNVDLISGSGSKEDPYIISDEENLFGSYVNLDGDIWRIYDLDGDTVKLSLNDYLEVNGEDYKYKYSSKGYYHNDTVHGSLAYYLNNNYLNSLSYKNIINSNIWSNGIYGSSNNFDYKKTLTTTIDTKVALLSVGNIILNGDLDNYYILTGTSTSSSLVYTIKSNGTLYGKSSTSTSLIVPTISIDKNILTTGNGTINDPYGME